MGLLDFFIKKKSAQSIFTCDRADYYWESAVKEYRKIHGEKKADLDNMDETEEATIWEYAGNHIAFFLTWIIKNDFHNTGMFEPEEIKLLQDEKISGTDFLCDYCDNKFSREFMDIKILDFVDNYYDDNYFNDYSTFIEEEMNETVLGTGFSWNMYHMFAPFLNRVYKEYLEKN